MHNDSDECLNSDTIRIHEVCGSESTESLELVRKIYNQVKFMELEYLTFYKNLELQIHP